jgi:tRNA(Phe) wybutosine-synthesizing methylase Tyw3
MPSLRAQNRVNTIARAFGRVLMSGSTNRTSRVLVTLRPEQRMDTPMDEAANFLREASKCLELASLMSLKADRKRMTEMAQRWLGLAQQAEAKRDLPERSVATLPKPGAAHAATADGK